MSDSSSFSVGHKVVLILVGLIGSGKSTFAQALQQYFPEFTRCNQDELGNRRQVELLARNSLRQGSVVIDRTNFDPEQRAHWIRIAAESPGTQVWVLVFDTPKDVCATRLRTRFNHPTIPDPADALDILERFSSQYRAPSPREGYQRILYLPPAEQETAYSRASLAAILCRLRDAPPVVPPVGPAVSTPATRGSTHHPRDNFFRGVAPHRGRYGVHRGAWNHNHASTDGSVSSEKAPSRELEENKIVAASPQMVAAEDLKVLEGT